MRVLAKFLGFIVALPFQYAGNQNKQVDNKQVELRNLQLPVFDVASVLDKAIKRDKLLITLPWLVEYLAMLDSVTLQLDYYRRLLRTFYHLYISELLPEVQRQQHQRRWSPMTYFILRLCLGWLFEQPHVATSLCTLEGLQMRPGELMLTTNTRNDIKTISCLLHPVLEKILPVACPFLAEFRLSVAVQKQSNKLVSRTTGRLRHIVTTKLPFVNRVEAAKNGKKGVLCGDRNRS